MIGMILVTHGRLAEEFVHAMEHVVGHQNDVATVCIGPSDDMEARRKEIAQARWQSTLDTLQKAYLQVLQERRYFVIVVNMSSSAYAKVRDYVPIVGPILTFAAFLGAVWFAFRRRVGDNWNEAVSGWRSR